MDRNKDIIVVTNAVVREVGNANMKLGFVCGVITGIILSTYVRYKHSKNSQTNKEEA